MATDFVADSGSPVSPSKSTLFPFLSSNDNQQRRPKAIGQITKTFSSFSITPTKHSYKPAITDKGNWVGATTRTPSITSVDSDMDHSTRPAGKLTLRVINPDPQDSSDEDDDGGNNSSSNINSTNSDIDENTPATRTNIDVTPTNSVLTHDAVVGATSSSSIHTSDHYDEAPSTPIPTAHSTVSSVLAEYSTSPTAVQPQQQHQQQKHQQQQQQHAKSMVIPTMAPKSTLVRRQSKTLDEVVPTSSTTTNVNPGLLPPLDLTPFDSPNFIPVLSSDSLHSSRSPYLRLSTTIEPAPALATPVNATPTTTTTPTALPSFGLDPPQPRADQISLKSFDRNTLTTMPGDSSETTSTAQHPIMHPHHQHWNGSFKSTTTTADAPPLMSKYAKASYSLTNNPDALRLYRDMANKTRDKTVQYTYANYLLEIAALYDQGRATKHTKFSSIKHSLGEASHRLRYELHQASRDHHHRTTTITSKPPLSSSSRYATSMLGRGSFSTTRPPSLTPPSPTATSLHSFTSATTAATTATTTALPSTHPHETHRRKKRALEEEGIRWMKRLTKDGMPDAAYTIATWMDGSQYGFSRNLAKSFVLYEVAAKGGIRDAVYKMGLYYETIGDHANALKCIKKASEQGIVHATLKLAKVYLHGELSQRQNMTLALSTLHQATNDADESCPEPPYMFGLILTNTYPKADIPSQVVQQYGGILACLPYFERAVHLGYPPAHSTLGSILEHGLYGLRVNYAQCYLHYTEAAKRGDAQGMVGLSRLNNRGLHGPGDDTQRRLALDESGWLAQHSVATATFEKDYSFCSRPLDTTTDTFGPGRPISYFVIPRQWLRHGTLVPLRPRPT
ncbi:hypothetical protein [Absidia glauca]|uniref:Uncharacterized protein n=1 Tax=Absidia glauca TaxID=4829 RepID=A0A168LFN9_ABSGL|nr:hypothetical protein [Absidia glauca]